VTATSICFPVLEEVEELEEVDDATDAESSSSYAIRERDLERDLDLEKVRLRIDLAWGEIDLVRVLTVALSF
jgi:hypothetical protein